MKSDYAKLTKKQILTQYFFIPTFGLKMAHGNDVYEEYLRQKAIAEQNGNSLELLGWPNGVTVFLKRQMLHQNLDQADLLKIYEVAHCHPLGSITQVKLC